MTALPQREAPETQHVALQAWARKTGTTVIFLSTATVSILLALIFGVDIWRIVIAGVLLVTLIACLALIVISAAGFFRDES